MAKMSLDDAPPQEAVVYSDMIIHGRNVTLVGEYHGRVTLTDISKFVGKILDDTPKLIICEGVFLMVEMLEQEIKDGTKRSIVMVMDIHHLEEVAEMILRNDRPVLGEAILRATSTPVWTV